MSLRPSVVPHPSHWLGPGQRSGVGVTGCPAPALLCFPPQYDEHVISPKEFVHLAGKSTLKDWKRAIRMNGIMLRCVLARGRPRGCLRAVPGVLPFAFESLR